MSHSSVHHTLLDEQRRQRGVAAAGAQQQPNSGSVSLPGRYSDRGDSHSRIPSDGRSSFAGPRGLPGVPVNDRSTTMSLPPMHPQTLDDSSFAQESTRTSPYYDTMSLGHSARSGRSRASDGMGGSAVGFRLIAQVKRLERAERRRSYGSASSFSERKTLLSTSEHQDGGENGSDGPLPTESVQTEKESALKVCSNIIFGKFVSLGLLCAPFAWLAHHQEWGPKWVFWLNFIVMIPLASILGDFTEEVALHTNQTVGGLINATFGNAIEVVVGIQALLYNEIRVVQASMLGSILSNLLLVLGCCFFFGGLVHKEQAFIPTAATANMGLLALSSVALVLPTPFAVYYHVEDEDVLMISRLAAGFLMFMYLQLLVFQLKTHSYLFDDDDDGGDLAQISMTVSCLGLAGVTVAVTIFSEFLVDSIDGFCEESGFSKTFVGLIVLPIVGNAVEHIAAVTFAMKNKIDLSMGIAVGSCVQISLFVVPFTVLVGWAMGKHMTLNFPHFEISLYILSVVTVAICVSNPKANWLEGSLLVTTYLMIAVGIWFEDVVDFRR